MEGNEFRHCIAVFQSSEILEKFPAVFESSCAECYLQWGHSELRMVKHKHETHNTKHSAAYPWDLFSSEPLTWILEYLLGVFSLLWSFSPEATTVSEPKEHLAFPQKMSSSARNRSHWLFQLHNHFPEIMGSVSKCCGNQVVVAPANFLRVICHILKFVLAFCISKNGESGMYRLK